MDSFVAAVLVVVHNHSETCFLRVWREHNRMLRAWTGQHNRMSRYTGRK
jgi:hypothetical protein